jgi:hypothetical protein
MRPQRFHLLLACVLLAGSALAQPPLTITSSGYFLTVLDDDGTPSFVRLESITDLTSGQPPTETPIPPTTPDGPDLDPVLVKDVQAWAESIGDPLTAQAIAAVYAHLRGATEDELVSTSAIWSTLKTATDSAVGIVAGKDWKPFRDKLSDLVTEGNQRGSLSSKADILRFMLSVQQGLELSADGSIALSMDKLVMIAKKTNEAIDAN